MEIKSPVILITRDITSYRKERRGIHIGVCVRVRACASLRTRTHTSEIVNSLVLFQFLRFYNVDMGRW